MSIVSKTQKPCRRLFYFQEENEGKLEHESIL